MEYLPDGDLESLIEKRRIEGKGFSLLDALLIVKSVAIGLHHAHRHGIIHRDIKPSNIFFSKDHRVVIGD
ncbi:MAG: serine/threonine protein kinase, partial [Phototrophicales bacterium]